MGNKHNFSKNKSNNGKFKKNTEEQKSMRIDEVHTGHKPIPIKLSTKVMKSICKITVKEKGGFLYGTGFFMNISNEFKLLITNYHVINPKNINSDINIEIWNQKNMKLRPVNRYIKYFEKPKDITAIEMKDTDDLCYDIEFLDYDTNYEKKGYAIYQDADVFSVEHPLGDDASCASGTILTIEGYEFDHNISTDTGSSGCPIILLNNNINLMQVIGIHKNGDKRKKINGGTFIGEIINEINIIPKKIEQKEIDNYILAEIYIKDDDINKNIQIINSYEEDMRKNNNNKELKDELKNENYIKKCEIKIDDKIIPFNYYHIFKNKGKYIIKYGFRNYITRANNIFSGCSSIRSIDLSNFNSSNVENMSFMFSHCISLTNINLLNLETQNVTSMNGMFFLCGSIKNIDLSNFNTSKVIDMNGMFGCCASLENINFSNFNTENVIDMSRMFFKCLSLQRVDLSNFKTKNVQNMGGMFYGCESLSDIDLSNFGGENVTNIEFMFCDCSSLKSVNLSNFKGKNVKSFSQMFAGCKSLKAENVKTDDIIIFNCADIECS